MGCSCRQQIQHAHSLAILARVYLLPVDSVAVWPGWCVCLRFIFFHSTRHTCDMCPAVAKQACISRMWCVRAGVCVCLCACATFFSSDPWSDGGALPTYCSLPH